MDYLDSFKTVGEDLLTGLSVSGMLHECPDTKFATAGVNSDGAAIDVSVGKGTEPVPPSAQPTLISET